MILAEIRAYRTGITGLYAGMTRLSTRKQNPVEKTDKTGPTASKPFALFRARTTNPFINLKLYL